MFYSVINTFYKKKNCKIFFLILFINIFIKTADRNIVVVEFLLGSLLKSCKWKAYKVFNYENLIDLNMKPFKSCYIW